MEKNRETGEKEEYEDPFLVFNDDNNEECGKISKRSILNIYNKDK